MPQPTICAAIIYLCLIPLDHCIGKCIFFTNFLAKSLSTRRSITVSPERRRILTGTSAAPLLNNAFAPLLSQTPSHTNDIHTINGANRQNGFTLPNPSISLSTISPSTPRPPYVNGASSRHGESGPLTPTQSSVPFQPKPFSTSPAGTPPSASIHNQPSQSGTPSNATSLKDQRKQLFYPSASTTLSAPMSISTGSTTLTYHLITQNLALLALIPTGLYEDRRGLVEYNVVFFREGIQEVCNIEEEMRGAVEVGG